MGSTTATLGGKRPADADVDSTPQKKVSSGQGREVRQHSPNPIEGTDSASVLITPGRMTSESACAVIKPSEKNTTAPSSFAGSSDDGSSNSKKKETKSRSGLESREISFEEGLPRLLFGDLQSSEITVVEKAMESTLNNVKTMTNLEVFIALGGPPLCMLCMKKFPSNAKIQRLSCELVAYMIGKFDADHNIDRAAELTETFLSVASLQLVCQAMENFEDEKLQWLGVVALGNLLCASGKSPHLAEKLSRCNGIELVVQAMKKFPGTCRLQRHSTWLLKRLCELGIGSSTMKQSNALVLVASAAENFPNNRDIYENTKSFFEQIFSQPPPSKKKQRKNVLPEVESSASSVTTATTTATEEHIVGCSLEGSS